VRFLLYIAVLLFLASLLTAVTQIRPGERAVIRRFGRVLDEKPGPGLWVGLPWGLDRVERVQVDHVRRLAVGFDPRAEEDDTTTPPGQLLTGDHNLVNVRVVIEYSVIDRDDEVARYVVQQDQVEDLITRAAETMLAEWVAGHPVDYVLLNGKAEIPRRLMPQPSSGNADYEAGLQARLKDYELGVQVRDASVALLLPPRQVKADFDRVNEAQTKVQTDKYRAEQDRSQWLGEAEAERDRVLKEAQAFAAEQRRSAETDAANFRKRLREYRRFRATNPDYLHDIWLSEMKKVYARMRENGGRIEPLDRLMGRDGIDIIQGPIRADKK
jgi:membrane protease subunit HflK